MKTIGLIGGMSWESTIPYYRIINEKISESLGGLHSARIILYSVEFAEIEACQANSEWDRSAEILGNAAVNPLSISRMLQPTGWKLPASGRSPCLEPGTL